MKFLNFFYYCGSFLLLDPDSDPLTRLNPDRMRVRIRNTGCNLLSVAERCGDPGTAGLSLLARHALPDDPRLLRHERGAAHRLGPAGRIGNKKPTQKNPVKMVFWFFKFFIF
jgi:hypothetical protein